MTKAYSYIRFSSKAQADGDSLRRQADGAETFAKEHGLELVTDYRDLGVSGYRGKNATEGALGEFLKAVEQGKIEKGSYLVVESLDRLSRDRISKAQMQFLSLLEAGINIATLTDNHIYTPDSADNAMQLIISLTVMSRAHEESKTKGDRVSKAWRQKRQDAREHKKAYTSRCPYWIKKTGDEYELIPERAAVVRRVFDMTKDGVGAISIAKKLNQEGVAPFGKGQFWHASYIKKILANTAVYGEMQPKVSVWNEEKGRHVSEPDGEPIEDYYPAVISKEDYHKALASRGEGVAGRSGDSFGNLFKGLCRCGLCGAPAHYLNKGKPPKGRAYLQCSAAKAGAGCDGGLLRYDAVELSLLGLFTELNFLELVPDGGAVENQRKDLRASIAGLVSEAGQIEKQLGNLADAVADGGSKTLLKSIEQKEQRQDEIQQERKRLEGELEQLDGLQSSAVEANQAAVGMLWQMLAFGRFEHPRIVTEYRLIRERLNGFYRKYVDCIEIHKKRLVVRYKHVQKVDEVVFHVEKQGNHRIWQGLCDNQLVGLSVEVLQDRIDCKIGIRTEDPQAMAVYRDMIQRGVIADFAGAEIGDEVIEEAFNVLQARTPSHQVS